MHLLYTLQGASKEMSPFRNIQNICYKTGTENVKIWQIDWENCEAQGKGRAKGRHRKSIDDCWLSIIDIDFPEALH